MLPGDAAGAVLSSSPGHGRAAHRGVRDARGRVGGVRGGVAQTTSPTSTGRGGGCCRSCRRSTRTSGPRRRVSTSSNPSSPTGGNLVLYAPHITQVSVMHPHITEIGYHNRGTTSRGSGTVPRPAWGDLALLHAPARPGHVGPRARGAEPGHRDDGDGDPREVVESVNLQYLDPATVDASTRGPRPGHLRRTSRGGGAVPPAGGGARGWHGGPGRTRRAAAVRRAGPRGEAHRAWSSWGSPAAARAPSRDCSPTASGGRSARPPTTGPARPNVAAMTGGPRSPTRPRALAPRPAGLDRRARRRLRPHLLGAAAVPTGTSCAVRVPGAVRPPRRVREELAARLAARTRHCMPPSLLDFPARSPRTSGRTRRCRRGDHRRALEVAEARRGGGCPPWCRDLATRGKWLGERVRPRGRGLLAAGPTGAGRPHPLRR